MHAREPTDNAYLETLLGKLQLGAKLNFEANKVDKKTLEKPQVKVKVKPDPAAPKKPGDNKDEPIDLDPEEPL